MQTLKERLKEWREFDYAAYELGVVLGLWPEWGDAPRPNNEPHDNWGGTKGIFWTDNPLGETLSKTLNRLVDLKMLEKNDEFQYKWNDKYDWWNEP
jgi:hypothetical protein